MAGGHAAAVGDTGDADGGQSAPLRLVDPGIGIAVSVENDPLVGGGVLLDQVVHRRTEVLRLLQHVAGVPEGLRNDGIEHGIGRRDRIAGAHHAEFEFITREGEG